MFLLKNLWLTDGITVGKSVDFLEFFVLLSIYSISMTFLTFFILGLIIGSFLNVVISRLSTLESIMGRSFCRHCRKQIRWHDNVPLLSFIVLRGKCRDCKEVISWQYPAVELGTALLFGCVGAVFFSPSNFISWTETIFALGIVSFGMVIFVYDLKRMEIPMIALWMAVVWTVCFLLLFDAQVAGLGMQITSVQQMSLHSGILAGLGAFSFFFFLSAISKERWMGFGDTYVALWIGLVLGVSWTFIALLAAFIFGALVGVALMLFSRKYGMKSRIPFAPFLIGSCIGVLFLQACTQTNPFFNLL